jgi:hypothetical protein
MAKVSITAQLKIEQKTIKKIQSQLVKLEKRLEKLLKGAVPARKVGRPRKVAA